jgi:hypothetical protein
MKKLLLFLLGWLSCWAAWAQASDSTCSLAPAAYSLRFVSYESAKVNGELVLKLSVKTQRNLDASGYKYISDRKGFFSYNDYAVRQLGSSVKGDSTTVTVGLQYNATQLPFYPVPVSIAFAPPGTANQAVVRDCYIYFTPYKTIEVWDQKDYAALRRNWLTADAAASSARQYIAPGSIPVSNIPAGYQPGPGEIFDAVQVPGLAYSVPMLHPDTSDVQYRNGCSGGVNNQRYKGQIQNHRIFTFNYGVKIPLRRGLVEVWWDVSGGSDRRLVTLQTDSEGYIIGNNWRTAQFDVCSASGSPLQIYLRIRMVDQYLTTLVWNNFFTISEAHTPRQPLPYNSNQAIFANLVFGQLQASGSYEIEVPEPVALVPFTWAVASRDHVWNALNGSSQQLTNRLTIFLDAATDKGFYHPSNHSLHLSPETRVSEFVVMHEFGHFVMHELSHAASLPGPGGDHSAYFNNGSAALTMTEGFANGLAYILDEMTFNELDQESGFGWINLSYHDRIRFGDYTNLTHPFVSELTMGAIMLDLWDGPTNLAAVNNPRAASTYEDDDDPVTGYVERYEMPLRRLLTPLFYRSHFSITSYFTALLGDNATSSADNQRIREVWHYNFGSAVPAINTQAFMILNMDEIDPAVTVTTPKFRDVTTNGIPDGSLTNTYPGTDIGVLSGSYDSFNVTTFVQEDYSYTGQLIGTYTMNANGVTLTDPVLVTNGAELGLHSGAKPRWSNRSYPQNRFIKRTNHLEIALREQARLTWREGTQGYIGSISPYQTTSVSLYSGTYIVIENGATLTIAPGSTLNIWEGATLLVRNGGTLRADGNLMIRWGGHICVEEGGNVRLSPSSTLYVDAGARMGVRAGVGLPASLNCMNRIAACGTVNIQHTGVVNVGNSNEALSFDGQDDVVTIPNTNSYVNSLGQQFTLEAFIKPGSFTGARTIFSSRRNNTTHSHGVEGLLLSVADGYLLIQIDGLNYGYGQASTQVPNDGRCHHVAVTRNAANQVRFFIDGQPVAYTVTTTRPAASTGPLALGADRRNGSTFQEFYPGTIGEVRVWNSSRTDQQIQQTFRTKLQAPQNGLVVYYDMQDLSAQGVSDGAGGASGHGMPLVPGILGASTSAASDDPSWVTHCALACDVQGNYRMSNATVATNSFEGYQSTSANSLADTLGQANAARPVNIAASTSRQARSEAVIAPNPSAGNATLYLNLPQPASVQVRILDLSGFEVTPAWKRAEMAAGSQEIVLPIQLLPTGLYLVVTRIGQKQSFSRLEINR